MVDAAKFREEFWRDVKEEFIFNQINTGPGRKRFIANIIKNNNIESVLELGCNAGGNLKIIRELCSDIKIVGFDINDRAIKYAQDVQHIQAEFILGSIYDLSMFKDKSFDLVFTCAVLVHLPSEKVDGIIKEMQRISKKFIFNIESNGKNRIMTSSNDVGYAWWTDYEAVYKKLGLECTVKDMNILLPKTKAGVANNIIYAGINNEKMII